MNEGESTARGLELEATYLASENLRFDGFLGLLDHEYDSFAPLINRGTFVTGVASPGVNVNTRLIRS